MFLFSRYRSWSSEILVTSTALGLGLRVTSSKHRGSLQAYSLGGFIIIEHLNRLRLHLLTPKVKHSLHSHRLILWYEAIVREQFISCNENNNYFIKF